MRHGYALLLWLVLVCPLAAQSADAAVEPCRGASVPAMPKPGAPPAIAIFHLTDPNQGAFRLPLCTGLNPAAKATLVCRLGREFPVRRHAR